MTFLLVLSHIAALGVGAWIYRTYASSLIRDAQEAQKWAESEIARLKSSVGKK